MSSKLDQDDAYRSAGVNIDAQDQALSSIKDLVRSTRVPGVLSELGSFGGLFRPDLEGLGDPLLVSSADGVGTKLMVARMAGDYSTVGHDLVNHCVNDILVQGAQPLFFLDYVGTGRLDPGAVVDLVKGVSAGCRENGCALLGGETAEMPGFYQPDDYELVGFVVGLVDRTRLIDGSKVKPGDVMVGLPSTGLHTNGYSLARRVFFEKLGMGLDDTLPSGRTVGESLLAIHKSYLTAMREHLGNADLHGLAHITGGGLTDNLPRILPSGCRAVIDTGRLPELEVFQVIQDAGGVSRQEMLRVFNMGVGMVAIVTQGYRASFMDTLIADGEEPFVIGEIVEGDVGVEYLSGSSS